MCRVSPSTPRVRRGPHLLGAVLQPHRVRLLERRGHDGGAAPESGGGPRAERLAGGIHAPAHGIHRVGIHAQDGRQAGSKAAHLQPRPRVRLRPGAR